MANISNLRKLDIIKIIMKEDDYDIDEAVFIDMNNAVLHVFAKTFQTINGTRNEEDTHIYIPFNQIMRIERYAPLNELRKYVKTEDNGNSVIEIIDETHTTERRIK
jgi:hypothetical protein